MDMEVELTRSDIINQLKKRHLQVTYLESLSPGQLEKIYQEFVVPRPRRQPRKRPAPAEVEVERLTQRLKMTSLLVDGEQSGPENTSKQIKMDLS